MKCSYCASEIKKGTGLTYVYRIGDISYFCSSKCFKNSIVLKRGINKKLAKRYAPVAAKKAVK